MAAEGAGQLPRPPCGTGPAAERRRVYLCRAGGDERGFSPCVEGQSRSARSSIMGALAGACLAWAGPGGLVQLDLCSSSRVKDRPRGIHLRVGRRRCGVACGAGGALALVVGERGDADRTGHPRSVWRVSRGFFRPLNRGLALVGHILSDAAGGFVGKVAPASGRRRGGLPLLSGDGEGSGRRSDCAAPREGHPARARRSEMVTLPRMLGGPQGLSAPRRRG